MTDIMNMTDEQADQIDKYSELGNDAIENDEFNEAIEFYSTALTFIPEPKEEWEATGWLHASIGDAYFLMEDYKKALEHFIIANNIYGAEPNAFILLRYGQCAYELKDEKTAIDFLLRAYKMEGKEIFEDEEQYLKFLTSHVKL